MARLDQDTDSAEILTYETQIAWMTLVKYTGVDSDQGKLFIMTIHIIRDSADARLFLTQGLWWQRVLPPSATTVRLILTWIKEIAAAGGPLPAPGFVADLGHVTFGEEWEMRSGRDLGPQTMALPMALLRTYEDHVLGKIYADWTFGRACDALRRYNKGREQARGLAYLITQFHERSKFEVVELPVGVINALLEMSAEEVIGEGWDTLNNPDIGLHPLLAPMYDSLIQASRRTAEMLGQEDIFDLESRAALEDLGQRLAHRQVLRAAGGLEALLPKHKIRPMARRMEIPTRILDEDTYPVGGFTSISNRGSIESLLHSQLAYMEPVRTDQPDLFDTMFLLDELLYYARDENQFLRRRRTFIIALSADLVETRFKDSDLPYQRGVMLLGVIHVLVKKLIEWLSTDALNFQFLFLGEGDPLPLANEKALLEKLFSEEIALDVVHLDRIQTANLAKRCEDWARKSMVQCLVVGVHPPMLEAKETMITRLAVKSSRPSLADDSDELVVLEGEDAQDSWATALQQILMRWI